MRVVAENKKIVRTYRDLVVWQKAISFVTDVYELTETFPRDEQFGLDSKCAGVRYRFRATSAKDMEGGQAVIT